MSDSFATPRTVALQGYSLFIGCSRQEYYTGLPFSTLVDLPNTRIESSSPALAGRFFTTEPPGKPMKGTLFTHYPFIYWVEVYEIVIFIGKNGLI